MDNVQIVMVVTRYSNFSSIGNGGPTGGFNTETRSGRKLGTRKDLVNIHTVRMNSCDRPSYIAQYMIRVVSEERFLHLP
jgi:hypothetical protein